MAESSADGFVVGNKTVTAAGTAEALSSSTRLGRSLTLVAMDNNTGRIFVGGSTVSSSTHRGMLAGDSLTISNPSKSFDLTKIYIDSSVSGEGVDYYLS